MFTRRAGTQPGTLTESQYGQSLLEVLPLLCVSTDMTKGARANLKQLITEAPPLIKEETV